jgi:eukaryotic-like serine/threonine-protein kinase
MSDIDATIAMSFQLLEQTLAQAIPIVPFNQADELVSLLPICPPDTQRLILSELIKLDMSKACEQGEYRQLDFYQSALEQVFEEHPISLDLVLEEVRVAKQLGHSVDAGHLAKRFPHLAEALGDCLSLGRKSSTNTGGRPPDFDKGQTVDDFRIIHCVGYGAFASVYLARQLSMGRLVALKVSTYRSDESLVLSQMDHPNIVRVYDQRLLSNPPVLLLYMEYVPGGTWDSRRVN